MGKVIIVVVALTIAVSVVAHLRTSSPKDNPEFPWLEAEFDRISRKVDKDIAGEIGQRAQTVCRQRFEITGPTVTVADVAPRYGSDTAVAFFLCVAEEMYPSN